ncbi:DUF5805 domain-containing protein [Halorubrum sp. DTA98]|uniref:DUF5805 domain-containing protein n=1 Tax=Halorubrum sp. DTA98 TaxID=3402163 RepID=UPI003AAC112C
MTDDRRSVKTYVPAHQKSEWQRHADELGMSQSEFVRTMVQAGRRGFSLGDEANRSQDRSAGDDPGGQGLERRIESVLAAETLPWEALFEEISGDLEDRIEDALESLQDRNRVRYNGREGGYTLIDG